LFNLRNTFTPGHDRAASEFFRSKTKPITSRRFRNRSVSRTPRSTAAAARDVRVVIGRARSSRSSSPRHRRAGRSRGPVRDQPL